jgi:GT2 family glycosyltransferase
MISIVTAYYNRKNLFYQTLLSISKSKFKDIELIAVDDCSSPKHRLEDLTDEFSFLKIIRLEKEKKWYINPCIPFNIGIREAKGDIIILQNPECFHVHDVISYINENVNDSNYISVSAYGLDPALTTILPEHNKRGTVPSLLQSLPQQPYRGWTSIGWYEHSIYRPVYFHFCSAITADNMKKLNGFDERYGNGIGYDDNEISSRIRRMGLNMIIEDKISVMHQYHSTVNWNLPRAEELTEKNRLLFVNVTLHEKNIRAN